MQTRKAIVVIVLAALLCQVNAHAEEGTTQVISDFTDDAPLRGWRAETGGEEGIRVELAENRATRGEHAVRLNYGTDGWRVARLDFGRRDAQDWRGHDLLKFDMYVDGPHEIPYLRIVVEASGGDTVGRSNLQDIPTGRWLTYTMPLRRTLGGDRDGLEGVDASQIAALRLLAHPNHPFEDRTAVYIDHVRLVDRSDQRVSALLEGSQTLMALGQFEGDGLTRVEAVHEEAAAIEDALSRDDEDREALARRISALERELPQLSDQALSALVAASAREAATTAMEAGMVKPDRPELEALERASNGQTAFELERRAYGYVGELAERALEDAKLRTRIRRSFADADFAIGTPAWPRAWKDDRYTGAVGRSVEIQAARNEFEPFQLVLLAMEDAMRNVRIEASALEGPGSISAEHIEIAPMGWRKLLDEPRWLADMLRPDITAFDVEATAHQPVWVNVYVPDDTPAGAYHGTLTIRADDMASQTVDVHLTVWDFTLPEAATLPTATNASPARPGYENAELFARLIIDRRWNPFQLYQWGDGQSVPWMRKLTDMGATLHNPLRISQFAANFERDDEGRMRVSNKELFFNKLDPIMERVQAEDPDLMEHILFYGFDEPSTGRAEAMDDLHGDFKERYDGVRTSFADLYGMWDRLPGLLENVDVWMIVQSRLTKDVRDMLQEAGKEVWWYNIYSREDDAVGLRVQYWGTFKDGLDGMLFYNLNAGGTGVRRSYKPWPASLWPEAERTDGTILRKAESGLPISTTTFEYWREGMEDVEYLYKLQALRHELETAVGDEPTSAHRALLREADRMLAVPGYITAGILDERATVVDEVVVETTGHTDDMNVILESRREIAHLIVQIKDALSELN